MKAKTLIPLVIGLAVGFFAIKIGVDMVQKAKGSQEDKTLVFVAAKSIDSAAGLNEQMIVARQVPTSLVPPESFNDKKALIGRVTKMSIPPGVTITRAMLAPPGAEPGLSAQIPPGHRAVSVKVNEETAVAGFITPGARVDVFALNNRQNSRGQVSSRLVLSNAEVGAVGQSLSKTGPDGKTVSIAKTVTLFLEPEEVQQLNSASGAAKGGLRLALRGPGGDPADGFFAQMFKKAMEQNDRPKPKKAPKVKKLAVARTHVVELRRGQMVEHLKFDEHGNVQRIVVSGPEGQSTSEAGPNDAGPNHTPPSDMEQPVVEEGLNLSAE